MRLRLERHAAHYEGGGGHDLEWIDLEVANPEYTKFGHPVLPPGTLPHGFEYHSGYVKNGVQHWQFCRRAPLSQGRCPRCPMEGTNDPIVSQMNDLTKALKGGGK